jgi:AraC-like DNA-binding protein
VQHVEFFHKEHFEKKYHRIPPAAALRSFIDFFWETDFDDLWKKHPKGFSDVLFPNTGYTYLINLGNPFIMQAGEKKVEMKSDGFLPRHTSLECYHRPGNKLFGIKFRVSPVIFEKNINFSEYRDYIFPLSYLIDPLIVNAVKKAASFKERVSILNIYFQKIVKKYSGSWKDVETVTAILGYCEQNNKFNSSIENFAQQYEISTRTLQRYFEKTTSISSKKALQIMRIRKAVSHIAESAATFNYSDYGYYDHSHFYKHLRQFLQKDTLKKLQPHLKILKALHQ